MSRQSEVLPLSSVCLAGNSRGGRNRVMRSFRRVGIAAWLAAVMAVMPSTLVVAQSNGSISGTATDEADDPYPQYSVRAREMSQGTISPAVPLDAQGNFTLPNLGPLS